MASSYFIRRRRWRRWLLLPFFLYFIYVLNLALFQRSLMYHPSSEAFVPGGWGVPELQSYKTNTDDGLSITSWYSPPKSSDMLTVVFFQGNAGILGYRNHKVRPWLDAGYGVMMVGYRGFSNPGSPSEQGLYSDARAALKSLVESGAKPESMVFYGESLGTAIAVQMALEYPVSGVVLESPFTSMPEAAALHYPLVPTSFIVLDRYDSLSKIDKVKAPVLIMHGEKDTLVPASMGRRIAKSAGGRHQLVVIPDGGHNNIYDYKIRDLVLEFFAEIKKSVNNGPGDSADINTSATE